jgi:O-antigen ligase
VFLLGVQLFKNPENLKRGFLLYFIPLLVVIIYTVVRHSMYGFDKDSAHWVMEPLFKDHTVYGAALALVFPISFSMLFSKKPSPFLRFVLLLGFVLLSLGLFLSFTRAAWLSVVGAVAVLLLLLLRISFKSVFFTALIVGGGLFFSWDEIQIALNRNKKESSDNIDEHLQSISNVSSDASNLERVNRWHCALAMFEERPIVGWGPGTYQFLYAPFQQPEDKTIISTNRGDGGNAHSEYLGPLAEQGVLGGMIFFTLAISIFSLGFRVFYSSQEYESKLLILGSFLGLVTYLIHGALNNFLDSDKVAIPFWMFVAFLVAQDLKLRENSNFQ